MEHVTSSERYERFTQTIWQGLLSQTQVKSIDVRHNVKLIGRSGATHQIDVYWEFEVAGAHYKTCVECKEYTSDIKQSHVLAFLKVLDDIGPNVTGIFVTTASYQKGAKTIAEYYNLRLLVLHPVLRRVGLTFQVPIPKLSIRLALDENALKEANLDPSIVPECTLKFDTPLLSADGAAAPSLLDLWRASGTPDGHHTIPLQGYLAPSKLGPLPLSHAVCDQNTKIHEEEYVFELNGAATVAAILDDVLKNTSSYVHDDGTTKPIPSEVIAAGGGPRLIRAKDK